MNLPVVQRLVKPLTSAPTLALCILAASGVSLPASAQTSACIPVTSNLTLTGPQTGKCYSIQAPNVTLDCQGNTLSRGDKDIGLEIVTLASGPVVKDVVVKNCNLDGFPDAIKVYMGGARSKSDIMAIWNDASLSYDQKVAKITVIEDALRLRAPQNITLSNVNISNAQHVGLYVFSYVHDLTFKSSSIKGTLAEGIYLDAASRNNSIIDSAIWNTVKEAIAVDSSAENLIANNDFYNNNGGIYLYKNCFEHAADPARATRPRVQHSHHNVIQGNRFTSGPYALWVASRQSEDLAWQECGDPVVYASGDARYYRDYAEDNSILDNDITNGSVIVEDDRTIIERNRFHPSGANQGIVVGSAMRQTLGTPVKDTVIDANVAGSDAQPAYVLWAYGTDSGRATFWTHFSDGTGFAYRSTFDRMGWSSGKWLVGDVDGDGKDDVIHVYGVDGKARAWVHRSTGNGFEYQSSFTTLAGYSDGQEWRVGDFDGDGRADLVNIYDAKDASTGELKARAWVHRSTGNGFEYQSSFTTFAGFLSNQHWLVANVDGRGGDDLVHVYGASGMTRAWVHRSTASGFEYQSSLQTLAEYTDSQRWLAGDVNFDGKDDLVNVYGASGQARAWVHRSNGDGFAYQSTFTTLANFVDSQRWLLSDVSGDDKCDLVNVYPNPDGQARAWTHRATSAGFEYQSNVQSLALFADSQQWLSGDFNGDGKADLINIYDSHW